MAKFVAKKAADIGNLPEFALLLNPGDSTVSDGTTGGFTLTSGATVIKVGGSGFTYDGQGDPNPTGAVSAITILKSGSKAYKFAGLDLDMSTLLSSPSGQAAIAEIFTGDDKFKGSNGDDRLVGDGGHDKIVGRNGDDVLIGGRGKDLLEGGVGKDELNGGGARDTYVFKDAPDSGVDTITQFQSGEEIRLDNSEFKKIGPDGKLAPKYFHKGHEAHDKNDHLIYDPKTGDFFYDANGDRPGKMVKFAELDPKLGFFHADNILVI